MHFLENRGENIFVDALQEIAPKAKSALARQMDWPALLNAMVEMEKILSVALCFEIERGSCRNQILRHGRIVMFGGAIFYC